MKKNLVLTGMMGVGKSTIGRILSRKLNMKFADIDKIIEKRQLRSIKNIFETRGEKYFRKIEKKITLEELKKTNLIIALGGGAFINDSVRNEINKYCTSFWLDLDLRLLLKRLENSKKRPLLNQKNLEKTINKIYTERKKFYSKSNFKIVCNALNTQEIVNKVIDLYDNSRNQI